MLKREPSKWFFEGALIVFSVLIALVINEAVAQRKLSSDKRAALERITLELESNAEILDGWLERHSAMLERLGGLVADREAPVRQELLASGYFDLGLVFGGESFIDAFSSKSAWEAARDKGIVSEFDYETVQRLSDVYSLQRVIMEQTVPRFSTVFFDRATHDPAGLDGTLIQFQLLAGELVGQETLRAAL